MQDYIANHLTEKINFAKIARTSLFSPWYARILFIEFTGLTPADYIRKLRLQKSVLCLRDTKSKIIDYIKESISQYVQGVEVDINYDKEIPDGFDLIELPAAKYLMFQGEPFKEEDFEQAITDIWDSIKK